MLENLHISSIINEVEVISKKESHASPINKIVIAIPQF